jgi:hypothetical protein
LAGTSSAAAQAKQEPVAQVPAPGEPMAVVAPPQPVAAGEHDATSEGDTT